MTEKITKKLLVEGFEKQKEQILDLFSAAQEQYDKKRYNISIALAILAIEELTKLRKIRDSDYVNGHMDISEWNQLNQGPGVHAKKIGKPVKDLIRRQEEKNDEYWDLVKEFVDSTLIAKGGEKTVKVKSSFDPEMVSALNNLKQACLYLDFKDKKWHSAKIILSQKEIEAIAYVTLLQVDFNLTEILLHNKHRDIEVDEESTSYKEYINDPLFEKRVGFQKISKSGIFQRKAIIAKSALKKFNKKKN